MVVLDEEAAAERSPVKTSHAPLPPQDAPPPAFNASTTAPGSGPGPQQGLLHGYPHPHPHHQHHPHQTRPQGESSGLFVQRTREQDTPGERFLKAFLCALFVLFLWGLFLDTLGMVGHGHGRY